MTTHSNQNYQSSVLAFYTHNYFHDYSAYYAIIITTVYNTIIDNPKLKLFFHFFMIFFTCLQLRYSFQ